MGLRVRRGGLRRRDLAERRALRRYARGRNGVVDLFETSPEPRRAGRRRQTQNVQRDQTEERRPLTRLAVGLQEAAPLRVVARDDRRVGGRIAVAEDEGAEIAIGVG